MERKCLIAGIPSAGKTTYIAALWDIINRNKESLELVYDTTPANTAYLNEIREYWIRMEPILRSKKPVPNDITINVTRKSDRSKMVLDIPDFMGEQFQNIISHNASEELRKWIEQSDRMLYLINLLDDDAMKDDMEKEDVTHSDQEEKKEGIADLTPDKMLSVSQNIMVLKYIWSHAKIERLAIGISAWDSKAAEGQVPEEYLKQRSPVLYNFIKYYFPKVLFFGVSAQGFDYESKDKAKRDEMRLKSKSSSRAYIMYDRESKPSTDLTRPINYLINNHEG